VDRWKTDIGGVLMTSHTKGPWGLETVRTQVGICHKIGPFPGKDGKQKHACIYVDYPGVGLIETELLANARLMQASPDLLEALKYARRMVKASECDIAFIDAAIAKASPT
jgi:hypothetical protein